jgi:hypothetical protein
MIYIFFCFNLMVIFNVDSLEYEIVVNNEIKCFQIQIKKIIYIFK